MVKKNKFSKKRYVITGLCMVMLLTTWFIYMQTVQARDRQRFKEAEETKARFVTRLVDYVGDNVKKSSEKNECYKSEYGPYDDGHLWCRVTSNLVIHQEYNDMDSLRDEINNIIDNLSLSRSNKRASDIEFQGSFNLPCTVDINAPNVNAENSITISCSDRAKAKHYPYTE